MLTRTCLVVFIDETSAVAKGARDQDDDEYDEDPSSGYLNSPSDESDARVPFPSTSTPRHLSSTHAPTSPTDRFIPHDDGSVVDRRYLPNVGEHPIDDLSSMRSHIYLNQDVWPLASYSEAVLFRHFVQKLSIWVRNSESLTCVCANKTNETR